MRRHALALAALTATSLAGCSALQALARGDTRGAIAAGVREGVEVGTELPGVIREAETKCDPLLKTRVTWPEERAIGGCIAIALTQKTQAHYFLDGATEKDPSKLKTRLEGGEKVTLPAGEKNALGAWVAVVGRGVASYSARPDLPWTFGVLDNPTPNAWSAPGGYVVVTTGLLKLVDNEAQLAGVLAHEVGHVTGMHAIKAYSESKHASCKLAIGGMYAVERGLKNLPGDLSSMARHGKAFADAMGRGGALDLDGAGVEGALVARLTDGFVDTFLGKGNAREQELESDRTALELLLFAGYDTTQYDALLRKAPSKGGMLDNHPSTDDRLAALAALRSGEYAGFANGKVKGEAPPALAVVKK